MELFSLGPYWFIVFLATWKIIEIGVWIESQVRYRLAKHSKEKWKL